MSDTTDEDKMAAEWAAMEQGGGGGADAGGGQARVLNQDEIDSLLGFDADSDRTAETSGIQAIVNSSLVSYEKLPMLEVVFDRLVRTMSTSQVPSALAGLTSGFGMGPGVLVLI